MEYEVIIGIEVHAELSTKTKIYCGCTTEFGGDPNTHCCPVCTGMPGALPVLNEKVVEYAVKAGLATGCEIQKESKQDRKNYFYQTCQKLIKYLSLINDFVNMVKFFWKLMVLKRKLVLLEYV